MIALFADGGVIGRNPSKHGGTWAWCQVESDTVVRLKASGVVTPAEAWLDTITNNYTELMAAVRGMESLPEGWDGLIHTDSYVTLCRISLPKAKFNGIPKDFEERTWAARKRLGKYRVVLLGGHPTKADLLKGIRTDGLPVSRWNVLCDRLCNQEAQKWREQHPEKIEVPS